MPKLIALITKKPDISDQEFQTYYETKHAPLIHSIFPMLKEYTRRYLTKSNLLTGDFTLKADSLGNVFSVITVLGIKKKKDLDGFMEIAGNPEIVEIIRRDEANFLVSEKTIMYKL